MAKSKKRKPSFDPAPPAGDSQTGWVYRSDQAESPRPASKRPRAGSKGGGRRPPATGPAPGPTKVPIEVGVVARRAARWRPASTGCRSRLRSRWWRCSCR